MERNHQDLVRITAPALGGSWNADEWTEKVQEEIKSSKGSVNDKQGNIKKYKNKNVSFVYGMDWLLESVWHSPTFLYHWIAKIVADNMSGLLCDRMRDWRPVLTCNNEVLFEVEIKWDIFQGDLLSLGPFVSTIIPFTALLRKKNLGYWFDTGHRLRTICCLWMIWSYLDGLKKNWSG